MCLILTDINGDNYVPTAADHNVSTGTDATH